VCPRDGRHRRQRELGPAAEPDVAGDRRSDRDRGSRNVQEFTRQFGVAADVGHRHGARRARAAAPVVRHRHRVRWPGGQLDRRLVERHAQRSVEPLVFQAQVLEAEMEAVTGGDADGGHSVAFRPPTA
jgi:hypothetical protein